MRISDWSSDVCSSDLAVLDAPMGAPGMGEGLGIEPGGGEIIAAFALDLAAAFDAGLDHGDGGEAGEARFAGIAAVREEPVDGMADGVAAAFEADMIVVEGFGGGRGGVFGRSDERRVGKGWGSKCKYRG